MKNKINIFNKPTQPISIGSVGNAVLQGNQVKVTFPKAIDKTNYSKEINEIEYQVRLSMYPILLTKTSTAPIEALKDATAVGSWTTLRGITAAGTTDLNAIITIPSYITDALVGVEVRAVDDYKRTPTESVTLPSILSIVNTKPAISAGTTEWTETSLKLFYSINDLGLLKLANTEAMLDAPSSYNASYIAYRNEVIKWLGDVSFSLDVTFEGSGASKKVTNELFKLSGYDLLNTTKSITLLHSATGVNKDKGYVVTSSLTKKGALLTSKAVLLNTHNGESDAVIHLTASTPSLQIGKTGVLVKLNEDQLDDTKAAGVFGRSEMHGVAGDSTKGASIALIDNRKGSNGLSLDQPALGFYANDDTEIGRIVAQEVDNGKYLAIKQQNFDPLYIRKNGTKLEYWEQGAKAGAGDWFTLLPEVMTTQMNADAQWNFDPSEPTTFRLGDSFYYKEGSGVILGNGLKITSGGINVPIEEYLNNTVITKQVRVNSSHSLIAIDEMRQPVIANDTITITATATYDTKLTWTAKGFKGSTPTTLSVTPVNNKVTTTANVIAPYDRVEYTVTSSDGAADSAVISSIIQTESGAVTIDRTTEYYAANSTGIIPKRSDAVWNTDISKVLGTAKYIYNYFVVEKTNDYDYISKPRMISSNGTAIPNTVKATRYYKRVNSGTVIPTSADTGWMNSLVQPTNDYKWLWTYLKPTSGTNFLDETYRTELIAIYGKISTPEIILHTAYADDDKGTNFSLVQGVRRYMGIYSSTAVEQSTLPSDYEWSLIKGEDGGGFTWNILKGTQTPLRIPATGVATHQFAGSSQANVIDKLGKYTFSADVKVLEGAADKVTVFLYKDANNSGTRVDAPIINGKIVATVETTEKTVLPSALLIYAGFAGQTLNNAIELSNYKLEYGENKNPTWSPHITEIYGEDGAPGKGIKDTKYRYAKTSAPSPEPTESQWSTEKPEYLKGDYAWTQVIWEYTDGTVENSAPMMSYIAEDGVGISDTLVAYALSTTNVQPADNLFNPEVPDSKPGDYVWTRVTLDYTDPNKTDSKFYTVARVGRDGAAAKLISLSASEQIFKNNTPTSITVTGLTQNTSITSWTYSSDSAAFTTALPNGVTRSGNVVTITQSTMTANTLTIKASDGTYSDTVTIAKVKDGAPGSPGSPGAAGMDGFTVILTNESQTFPANSEGTVTSYANGYSDVVVYYGSTALTCANTGTAAPTVNNTYTVTSIAATSGTVTTTPSLVSSNYRITPSALNTDNAIRTITIVARINGANYTFKKVLTYTKSKSGANGADAAIASTTPPTDTNKLWRDLNEGIVKQFNETTKLWEPFDATIAKELEDYKTTVNTQIDEAVGGVSTEVGNVVNTVGALKDNLESVQDTVGTVDSNREAGEQRLQDLIDANKTAVEEELEVINTHFNFSDDGLLIGKDANPIKMLLDNDSMSFMDNGVEVASISNEELIITDGVIKRSLSLGNFEFVPRESGNLSFRRKG